MPTDDTKLNTTRVNPRLVSKLNIVSGPMGGMRSPEDTEDLEAEVPQ